jgi:hypothetical protein
MRYSGVNLHKRSFVVYFLASRGPCRVVTFLLTQGRATYCRQGVVGLGGD